MENASSQSVVVIAAYNGVYTQIVSVLFYDCVWDEGGVAGAWPGHLVGGGGGAHGGCDCAASARKKSFFSSSAEKFQNSSRRPSNRRTLKSPVKD
jgi:hypothetical protein